MSAFFVRTARVSDLPAVRDLLRETWHATYDAIYGAERVSELTASWHSLEALRTRLSQPSSEFLVANDGVHVAGMAFATAGSDRKVVLLHQLYVRPDWQGRGIGSNFLAEIEASFPEAERLRLDVEELNAVAQAFYTSKGFEPVGRDEFGRPDEGVLPALIFEKRLR